MDIKTMLTMMSKKQIVKEGLVLHLDGRDFTNYPPSSVWKDRSGLGNNATPSGFGYIAPYAPVTSDLAGTNQNVIEYSTGDGKIHFEVEGNTLKNELTYNKDTWAEWTKASGVVGDNTGLEIITTSGSWITARTDVNLKVSTKYGYLINIVSNNIPNNSVYIDSNNNPQSTSLMLNGIGNIKFIDTTKSSFTYNRIYIATLNTLTNGLKIKLKDVRVYELPPSSEIESDFNTLTADQLSAKYPFASGIKSVGEDVGGVGVHGIEVLSTGKNRYGANEFYDELYAINSSNVFKVTKDGRNCVKMTNHGLYYQKLYNKNKFKPNIQYTLKLEYYHEGSPEGTLICFHYVDGTSSNTSLMAGVNSWITTTITSTVGKSIDYIMTTYVTGGTPTYINIDTFQLEEGSIATTYTPYTGDKINISLQQPLRKVSETVKDKYSEGSVSRNIEKVVFDGSVDEDWKLYTNSANANSLCFYISITGKKTGFTNVISDKFSYINIPYEVITTLEGISGTTVNSNIFIRILNTKLPSIDVTGFKAWLASNPTTVFYELATPQTEAITVPQLNGYANGSLLVDGYIPTKTNLLTSLLSATSGSWKPLDVDMPTLPNGVKNEVVNGSVVQKVGKVVLNGSESWSDGFNTLTSTIAFNLPISNKAIANNDTLPPMVSDKFSVFTPNGLFTIDSEGITISASSTLKIKIAKSKLSTQDAVGFKAWLQANPTTVWYELATPIVGGVSLGGKSSVETLNGNCLSVSSNVLGSTPQIKVKFDLISAIEQKYGTLPCPNDITSKVAWAKANASSILGNGYIYGLGVNGNKAYFLGWFNGSWVGSGNGTTTTPSPANCYFTTASIAYFIQSDGFVHLISYTDQANINTDKVFVPSTINMDYISLQVTFKTPSGSDGQGKVIFDSVDDKITIPNSGTFVEMYKDGVAITPSGVITTAGTYKNIVAYNRQLTAQEIEKNLKALR